MSSTQLDKVNLIFKREKMEISAADIVLPSYLDLKWETVGVQLDTGLYEPHTEFLNNVDEYLHNKFLDIGDISIAI